MKRTHGMTNTPEYRAWHGMKQRCYPSTGTAWLMGSWAGRGITVCDRWRNSFEAFYADMGPRPSTRHSLDRINNDGNYEPGNCRWADDGVQSKNRRNTGKNIREVIHAEQAVEMIKLRQRGETWANVGNAFGVSGTSARGIVLGKTGMGRAARAVLGL